MLGASGVFGERLHVRIWHARTVSPPAAADGWVRASHASAIAVA